MCRYTFLPLHLRKKIDEAKALESSNEFKELKKKFDADMEALKHKKLTEPGGR